MEPQGSTPRCRDKPRCLPVGRQRVCVRSASLSLERRDRRSTGSQGLGLLLLGRRRRHQGVEPVLPLLDQRHQGVRRLVEAGDHHQVPAEDDWVPVVLPASDLDLEDRVDGGSDLLSTLDLDELRDLQSRGPRVAAGDRDPIVEALDHDRRAGLRLLDPTRHDPLRGPELRHQVLDLATGLDDGGGAEEVQDEPHDEGDVLHDITLSPTKWGFRYHTL